MPDFVVIGARGAVHDPQALLERLRSVQGGEVLAMDADMVCGEEHARSAVEHALRAFDREANTCNDVLMEAMLFASGERQISKAREKMGVKAGTERVALVLFGPDPEEVMRAGGLERDDGVLLPSREKALRFGVPRKELDSVPEGMWGDLVLERVAFVEILKR